MAMAMGSYASRVVATAVVAIDGTGDFTDIQAAIDSLPAGGGVVYIKEGTYTISTAIQIQSANVSLIGAGASTIITVTALVSVIEAGWPAPGGEDNITIESLMIDGTLGGSAGINGIVFNSEHGRINNVWITNCSANGCTILGTGIGIVIINSFFYSNGADGINITGENVLVSGNISSDNGRDGIRSMAFRSTIIDNISRENYGHGISLFVRDGGIVANNIIKDNDVDDTATYDGIYLDRYDNAIISGNRCEDNDRYEINISTITCEKNVVEGNICVGADHVGAINDAGTDTQIGHNITT